MAGSLTPRESAGRRRLAALGLVVAVTVVHMLAGDSLLADRFGWGEASRGTPPARIEVAYVRELAPAAPATAAVARPVVAARRAPASGAVRARPTRPPASAPQPGAPVEVIAEPAHGPANEAPATPPAAPLRAEAAPSPEPAASEVTPAAVAGPAAPAASAPPAAATFEWPPSTRLSYRLNGNYRGEVQGRATVEWLRSGARYQVRLEAVVGPPVLPLMARRIQSDGEITDAGLAPRRFDGEQRVGFGTRRWSLQFSPERIVLADGKETGAQTGVQDEASQFVQLTWLFTTQPHLLQPGRSIAFPLVLRRRVDRWVYDVVGEEELSMPFGPLPTMHVKPRRPARPGGDMTAEMWVAPSLQYLPVRILIRQDETTFVDLMLERAPEQAAR